MLVPDHRRTRRALDRRLDFQLGRTDGAGNDLQLDRAERGSVVVGRHGDFSRIMLPKQSLCAHQLDGTTVVDPYSSITVGPAIR